MSSLQTIYVNLPEIRYPIYIGEHIYNSADILLPHIRGQQVVIVSQQNIAHHHLAKLKEVLAIKQCDVFLLPEGEAAKNIQEWQKIIDHLLLNQHERTTTLIAFGGGIVGDMTGFAAACYQRGVNYIQIPTTVIAQVDAAIGGKTGINHAQGKNMLGAFHQPQCVIADVALLSTLPQREFNAGFAEVIKYGLLCDIEFFIWLENNALSLLQRDKDALCYAIHRCAAMKAAIVAQDEKENGVRSLLNLGHTFGHALEVATAYRTLLHGEAVAWGMLMAAELSCKLKWITADDVSRIAFLLNHFHLLHPVTLQPSATALLNYMKSDKKVRNGNINLVLLKKMGEAIKVGDVQESEILQVIEAILTRQY